MTLARSLAALLLAASLAGSAAAFPFDFLISADWSLPGDPAPAEHPPGTPLFWQDILDRWPDATSHQHQVARRLELLVRLGPLAPGSRELAEVRARLREARIARCPGASVVPGWTPEERKVVVELLASHAEQEARLRAARAELRWVRANTSRREEHRRAFLESISEAYPEVTELRELLDARPCGWLGVGCPKPDPEAARWKTVRALMSNPFKAFRFLAPLKKLEALKPGNIETLEGWIREVEAERAALPALADHLPGGPCTGR